MVDGECGWRKRQRTLNGGFSNPWKIRRFLFQGLENFPHRFHWEKRRAVRVTLNDEYSL
jgi:hypothetical protein